MPPHRGRRRSGRSKGILQKFPHCGGHPKQTANPLKGSPRFLVDFSQWDLPDAGYLAVRSRHPPHGENPASLAGRHPQNIETPIAHHLSGSHHLVPRPSRSQTPKFFSEFRHKTDIYGSPTGKADLHNGTSRTQEPLLATKITNLNHICFENFRDKPTWGIGW